MQTTFDLLFAAPIPVGHRVELIWRGEPTAEYKGILGKPTIGSGPADRSKPTVRDLDTGIIYGPLDHYLTQTVKHRNHVRPIEAEPNAALEPAGHFIGRVLACRVLSQHCSSSSADGVQVIQTVLVVQQDA